MFFILGLPRSRTAWLANFMSTDGLTCMHEGLNGCKSLNEYKSKFDDNTGDSNTGIAMFDFEKHFKSAKIVVIDNSIDSAVEYGFNHFNTDITEQMIKLQHRLNNIEGLHVPFKEIDNNLENIWSYITDKPYNSTRTKILKGLNIQVKQPYVMDVGSFKHLMESENGGIL